MVVQNSLSTLFPSLDVPLLWMEVNFFFFEAAGTRWGLKGHD